MKKNGFSLVELMAVLVIIGVVSLIVIKIIQKTLLKSKQESYEIQVREIKKMASKWTLDEIDLLDTTHLNPMYLPLSVLKEAAYFDNELRDPRDKSVMDGCIKITYENEQYVYTYLEEACESADGYHYTYQDGSFIRKENNIILAASDEIIKSYQDQGLIKTDGQTTDGLYDLDSVYTFRGSNVNNYVKFENSSEVFRILNIKDDSIRLISTTGIPNAWDAEGDTTFENATVVTVQLDNYYQNESGSIVQIKNKINEKAIWNTGVVSNTAYSRLVLRTYEQSKNAYLKLGLINMSDYVSASLDEACSTNFLSNTCMNQNYLYDFMKEKTTWTMHTDENKIWSVNASGQFELQDPTSTYYIYPVVELSEEAYIKSGTGESSNPYIIA